MRLLLAPTSFYGTFAVGVPVLATIRGSLLAVAACWLGGLTFYTFYEYAFHRWIQHSARVRRWIVRWDDHARHHAHPEAPADFVFSLHESLPILAPVVALAVFLAPSLLAGLTVGAGFLFGYVVNEWVHLAAHLPSLCAGRPWLACWAANHQRHHQERGDAYYGFITSFWDRVLGTFPPPSARQRGV